MATSTAIPAAPATTAELNGAGPARRLPPAKRRLRLPWMLLGALLVITGALLTYWQGSRGQHRVDVLAMARPVDAGQVIDATDLRVVGLSDTTGLAVVPKSQAEQVLGRRTSIAIPAGALLSPTALAATRFSPGDAIVGLALSPGQMPTTELHGGERVTIVGTPHAQDNPPTSAPAGVTATVLSATAVANTDKTVVNVRVPAGTGALLAVQAATGRVSLILLPAGGAQ